MWIVSRLRVGIDTDNAAVGEFTVSKNAPIWHGDHYPGGKVMIVTAIGQY